MLDIEALTGHYNRVPALHGVSVAVREGELVAIVGANGAGKTTLLRTISGVRPASSGRISFEGTDITNAGTVRRVSMGIVQVPEGRQVFGPLSVDDNLRLGAYLRPGREAARDLDRIYEIFPPLAKHRRAQAGMLSGGQQQMLAMGRALMARPRLLLLDEPSMGLAPLIVQEIFDHVARLRREGTTILLVDQNAHAALAIADRAYVLETGRIVLEGSGSELAGDPTVREAYLGL